MKNVGDYALDERLSLNQRQGTFDFNRMVLDLMDIKPGLGVLDVACGNGHFTVQYKKITGSGFVAGIDQSGELISKARGVAKDAGLDVEFKVAGAEALPYADGSFDRVSCNYAVYHFPDIRVSMDEMLRVMKKPGSKLLLTGPSKLNNGLLYHYHEKAGGRTGKGEGRYVYEDKVGAYLRDCGIKHKFTLYENAVTFPCAENYLDYYRKTKLFLDNVKPGDREGFIKRVLECIHDEKADVLTLIKEIGVFEAWT